MVPMTTSATSPRSAVRYRLACVALDSAASFTTGGMAAVTALMAFANTGEHFVGGLNGRVVFSALCAVIAAYAGDSLCDAVFGGLRSRLAEAHLSVLIVRVKDAREAHASALAQLDAADPDTSIYLVALKRALDKAVDRALRAGALPAELS